jgi:hypothetical protein
MKIFKWMLSEPSAADFIFNTYRRRRWIHSPQAKVQGEDTSKVQAESQVLYQMDKEKTASKMV